MRGARHSAVYGSAVSRRPSLRLIYADGGPCHAIPNSHSIAHSAYRSVHTYPLGHAETHNHNISKAYSRRDTCYINQPPGAARRYRS